MNNKIKRNFVLIHKIITEKKGIIASFVSILIGIILGSCIYNSPDFSLKNKLLSLFVSFNTEITDKTHIEIFSGLVLSGLIYYVLMFFCGGNIFGKELSLLVTSIKASGIGALIAFLYNQYSVEGFEYTLLVFMPGKCLLIFAMLFLTESSFDVSGKLRSGTNNADAKLMLKTFNIKSAVALGIMFLSLIIDYLCLIGFSKLVSFTQN